MSLEPIFKKDYEHYPKTVSEISECLIVNKFRIRRNLKKSFKINKEEKGTEPRFNKSIDEDIDPYGQNKSPFVPSDNPLIVSRLPTLSFPQVPTSSQSNHNSTTSRFHQSCYDDVDLKSIRINSPSIKIKKQSLI